MNNEQDIKNLTEHYAHRFEKAAAEGTSYNLIRQIATYLIEAQNATIELRLQLDKCKKEQE